MLLYGLNGSGKSIFLKSVGLNLILAQCGFYVPSESFTFYPYKNLITKISMDDNQDKGESTFICEMLDLSEMLNKKGFNTLILGDELCSGTETDSAIALVSSAIIQFSKTLSNFIFTTHFHPISELRCIKELPNIKTFHISNDVIDKKIVYNRKIEDGSGPQFYGIEVAKQLDIGDKEFIKTALNIRSELIGKSSSSMILSTKTTKYNKDVYLQECHNCGSTKNIHTHHIIHQSKADKNGMLPSGIHKNHPSNLEFLCETCHIEHHKHDK
jgi:DNA mismatch repair protein MutS